MILKKKKVWEEGGGDINNGVKFVLLYKDLQFLSIAVKLGTQD